MMDHQQQTQQTEQIIIEMLEFLETSSSDEENDLEQQATEKLDRGENFIQEEINEDIKNTTDSKGCLKKEEKPISTIANELLKLKQQLQWKTNEMDNNQRNPDSLNCKTNSILNGKADGNISVSADPNCIDWQYKLENHWRRSYSNTYTQEIYKAIYQDSIGHPISGSADYYQAAQNYVFYGKHFLDFPENVHILFNDKNLHNFQTENSNSVKNFGSNFLYTKPNTATPIITIPAIVGVTTAAAASAAAYYQICNNTQAQARPALSTNNGNSTAYGIFLGNKVTYVAGSAATPSLIYNQHSATATNFISNSLANAALATSPAILYSNPMLTTTTQQYLTQFLNTAALTVNSLQSATAANTGSGASVYDRLIYAQMLKQQLYQTQQAATIAAMFQHKQRIAAAAAAVAAASARQANNAINGNTNRSSPQHVAAAPTASITNPLTVNTCNRQARSSSPSELVVLKPPSSGAIATAETNEYSKSVSD